MFTHLHTHTEYSLLDGLSTIPDLVARAKALGQDALAITDHGNLHGALQFYEEARANEIKPIIGLEGYVAPGSRFDRSAASRTPFHLTLLAQNETGYRNLLKLSTASHLEGFYYRPRVDRELLEQHNEGLIALSACPSGEVMTALQEEREPDAREALGWYSDVFRGRYYVELQEHGQEQFSRLNPRLVSLARDLDLPLVLTNDSHYTAPEQEHPHDVLLCIGTNSTIPRDRPHEARGRHLLPALRGGDAGAHARAARCLRHDRAHRRAGGHPPRLRAHAAARPRHPRGHDRRRLPPRALRGRPRAALPQPRRGAARAAALRARGDRRDRVRRVHPDRPRHRPLRTRAAHPDGRARLGRRLDRALLPRRHRHRADAVPARLRTLPQPRAARDAGRRLRLRRRPPRGGDPLRRRALRPRPRRADRHLRDARREGRDPRQRARPRHVLRRGRPRRPARAELARHHARPRARRGRGSAARGRGRPGRQRAAGHGAQPGGRRPPRQHARRRHRDLARAAGRRRAAAARHLQPRRRRAAAADDAVRHERRGEDRAAQARLPRARQPPRSSAAPPT